MFLRVELKPHLHGVANLTLLAEYKLTCLPGLQTAVENHSCSHLQKFMLFQTGLFIFSARTHARCSPLVKTAVYDGVVHRRTHGKEKDCEVNLLNVLLLVDVFLEAPQDEVYVIGQPADSKNDHNYHHGLHKLETQDQSVIPGPGLSWDLADSPDTGLHSLRTAGNWPTAYQHTPVFPGGWLVHVHHHFFFLYLLGEMPFTPSPKYFVNLSCPISQDFVSNASSVLELESAGLVR